MMKWKQGIDNISVYNILNVMEQQNLKTNTLCFESEQCYLDSLRKQLDIMKLARKNDDCLHQCKTESMT